ncbi:hypothetical protein LCGC14_1769250 [marine sediment metagenome]|uniref:Uncharacterized protein n=1 Tax=marine sediment metagenome TaxID=412755 RepID=A0A0F9JDQ4_9ZZZZ
MVKQIPKDRPLRGKQLPGGYDEDGVGPGLVETNTMYLNAHAEEWRPPLGLGLHLHLMYTGGRVNWQVVERVSLVCKVPGRCHRVGIFQKAVVQASVTRRD